VRPAVEVAHWLVTALGYATLALVATVLGALAFGRFVSAGRQVPTPSPLHDPLQDDLNHRLRVEFIRSWMSNPDVAYELRGIAEATSRDHHPSRPPREEAT
jgi:hypothetical protein